MLNSKVRNLAITVIATASALGLTTALSAAPALASSPSYKLIVNSGETALDVTANGAGKPVTISNSGTDDNWVFVNTQSWSDPFGAVVQVSELQHAGTDNCINDSSGVFVISGCTAGDPDELFYGLPTGSTTNGSPNYWYINEAATDAALHYVFMTAASYTNGADVLAEEVGQGGLAAWNRQCSANC
jgi:hypothetical protein